MWIKAWLILLTTILASFSVTVFANEDSARIQMLTEKVAVLSAEIDELKVKVEMLNTIKPDVATLMPDIAERMHVMHYAGEAQDWAVASHELAAINRLFDILATIDPVKGGIAEGFMHESFEGIDEAIDHGNQAAFTKAVENLVSNCNSCHVAADSPAMKISLNVDDALSLRHSHNLVNSKGMGGGHMHN